MTLSILVVDSACMVSLLFETSTRVILSEKNHLFTIYTIC